MICILALYYIYFLCQHAQSHNHAAFRIARLRRRELQGRQQFDGVVIFLSCFYQPDWMICIQSGILALYYIYFLSQHAQSHNYAAFRIGRLRRRELQGRQQFQGFLFEP
jgi:hypothetical protein